MFRIDADTLTKYQKDLAILAFVVREFAEALEFEGCSSTVDEHKEAVSWSKTHLKNLEAMGIQVEKVED